MQITNNTVFYADWVAETYDIGQYNEDTVKTVDTSEFVTMDVFDFNVLFNAKSSKLSNSSISNDKHSENWAHVTLGNDTYNFVFVDSNSESSGKLANTTGRNSRTLNVYTGGTSVFPGIMPANLNGADVDLRLINALFDKNQTDVVGRHYLGTGNHLFQYDSDPASDHYGYYYYDSEINAAAYHQSDKRFYVYNYLEHASSSNTRDFLPLNSPYANNPGSKKPSGSEDSGYHYHTTNNNNQTTDNFFFGMKTNIHFYLPNDVGFVDNNNNPGNLDTNGNPMIFDFSGDDDVWIYVDGVLVLDIGGIHQANGGSINFSTGQVILDGKAITVDGDKDPLNNLFKVYGGLKEGGHDLTIYYLERGCGESNCSIYFNLAPRYGLTLRKQDYHTRENLNNVQFGVYLDEACTKPANLWPTHADAKADPDHEHTQNIYSTQNGYLSFFGLVAGKTYYIKELSVPSGYPSTNDLIRVTLNNHGVDISEVTMLGGSDGRTQGYELISHHLDEVNQVVNLVLTNQKIPDPNQETKHVRVTKEWVVSQQKPAEIPDSVTVHLTKNGQHYGHSMTLSAENGWAYTWTNLPDDGSLYDVLEDQVPGFELVHPAATFAARDSVKPDVDINWLEVGALEDSATYLLKVSTGYLAQDDGKLQVVTIGTDSNGELDPPTSSLWNVEAVGEGFRLTNGSYALTLDGTKFTVKQTGSGNQTLYYDGEGIFAMQSGKMYYISVSGSNFNASDVVYQVGLVKREEIPVDIHHVKLVNSQLAEEKTTFLRVNKVWDTESAIWDREITIHLYRNGVDTGIAMLLDRNCNWEGTFEGLPLKDANGNLYSYSAVEASVEGYKADYSAVTTCPARQWKVVRKLEKDNTYVLVGTNSMALSGSGNSLAVSELKDSENPAKNQKWLLTSNNKLKNLDSGRFLKISTNGSLSVTDKENEASQVSLVSNQLCLTNGTTVRYLNVTNSVSVNKNSGTTLTIYQQNTGTLLDGYQITVTNSPFISYILPSTGGPGIGLYTLLGLAMVAIAVTTLLTSRRKGGRYAR